MTHPFDKTCPRCAAPAGEHCMGKRARRKSMHRERWYGPNFNAEAGLGDELAESPIERQFIQAMRGWLSFNKVHKVNIRPQVPFGPYRADVLIEDKRRPKKRLLVVECDGRAFHSSDRAQDRDRQRDRWFAANDIFVMRFSGAEIHRDSRGCAVQVGAWLGVSDE